MTMASTLRTSDLNSVRSSHDPTAILRPQLRLERFVLIGRHRGQEGLRFSLRDGAGTIVLLCIPPYPLS
jgi:hypothetical protein